MATSKDSIRKLAPEKVAATLSNNGTPYYRKSVITRA